MAVEVTVTNSEALDAAVEGAIIDITFTNKEAYSYAQNSTVYYYALLTDSASTQQEVTFKLAMTTEGTIQVDTRQPFVFENLRNLVAPITATNGRILYTPQ